MIGSGKVAGSEQSAVDSGTSRGALGYVDRKPQVWGTSFQVQGTKQINERRVEP